MAPELTPSPPLLTALLWLPIALQTMNPFLNLSYPYRYHFIQKAFRESLTLCTPYTHRFLPYLAWTLPHCILTGTNHWGLKIFPK